MFCEIAAMILLFVSVSNSLYYRDPYTIPEPRVEVLKPRGFRISIEDSPGISRVAFYVNINKEFNVQEPTDFSGNISAVAGRWTFHERNVVLKIGDVINYAVVITKDQLIYQTEEREFLYTNEVVSSTESQNFENATCRICKKNIQTSEFPTTQSPEDRTYSQAHTWEQFGLNCSQTLITVQSKMETLNKINQQLINFIEKYPDAKYLTLTGRIPTNENPVQTVKFILLEKLDINPDISSAVRSNDESIRFKVDKILDKLEILEVSKEKLKHSRIFIS